MDRRSAESANAISRMISEDKRLSKHSSITSEVDLAVAETSISEAVVKTVSTESFVTLETGTTVKLSITEIKENNDKKETAVLDPRSKTSAKRVHSEKIDKEQEEIKISDKTPTNQEKTETVTMKKGDGLNNDTNEHVGISTDISKKEISAYYKKSDEQNIANDGNDIIERVQKPSLVDNSEMDDITMSALNQEDRVVKSLGPQNSIHEQSRTKTDSSEKESNANSNNRVSGKEENKSILFSQKYADKEESDRTSPNDAVIENVKIDNIVPVSNHNDDKDVRSMQIVAITPTAAEHTVQYTSEASTPPGEVIHTPLATEGTKETPNTSSNTNNSDSDSMQIIPTSEPVNEENVQATPEAMAAAAKVLTMNLAKQMVDKTVNVRSQMIGSTNNALTLYNGSTMELADVDYFVIFKADSPKQIDGIAFYARIELGTNSITKVIPVSPTKAWVSYYGGGVKLIDTEKEAVVHKIEVTDIDTIATSDESFLFTSYLGNSRIERMHIVNDDIWGSSPLINLPNCRIACMCMSYSGNSILLCVEKRHSCLCIPKKSEIVVMIHELTGKRSKELKPKVNGRHTPMNGFPIVMCENVNGDMCIAEFSHDDHTCLIEVYSHHLERKFVYEGDRKLSERFMCEDICTDKQGNILILDNSLKAVHIISKDGILAKIISTPKYQIEKPKCINVDSNGRLWIGQGPPAQMIILEYSVLPASL